MAFVLDCFVATAWTFADEATDATNRLREALVDAPAFVAALWPVETANALLVATRRGRIGARRVAGDSRAPRCAADGDRPGLRIPHVGCGTRLGEDIRDSVYDAMYLELAVRMRMPLATLDWTLGAAGKSAGVHVPAIV